MRPAMPCARLLSVVGLLAGGLPLAAQVDPLRDRAPVARAAQHGDLQALRGSLAAGADVDAPQGDGMTALHWAAERGDLEILELLLAAGVGTEPVTRLGAYTPLHLACRAGQGRAVEVLLRAGSDHRARTSTGGATPLHLAAAADSARAIAALIEHGADPDAREASAGQTPLIVAASYGRLDAVRVLVDRGADVHVETARVDVDQTNARVRAARQKRDEVLAAFRSGVEAFETGYSPAEIQAAVRAARQAVPAAEQTEEEEEEPDPDAILFGRVGDYGGLTALLHAAREGHIEVGMALLDAGADIERPGTGDGMPPMLLAIVNGQFDLAMRLLERGADPNGRSSSGNNPIYAVLNAHWAGKSAARPRQRDSEQQETGYLELMEALLLAGADPNARLTNRPPYEPRSTTSADLAGATPFFRAAYATDVDAMRLLVRNGADDSLATIKTGGSRRRPPRGRRGGGTRGGPGPEREDPSGLPPVPEGGPGVYPIHAATGLGYGQGYSANTHRHVPDGWMPALRYLVEELGHDVNARDLNGYTPLHNAASRGDDEMVMYLVEHGADVRALSRRGQTTADMANQPGARLQIFPETRALLMRLGSRLTGKPKY